jgi:hypothetical protein
MDSAVAGKSRVDIKAKSRHRRGAALFGPTWLRPVYRCRTPECCCSEPSAHPGTDRLADREMLPNQIGGRHQCGTAGRGTRSANSGTWTVRSMVQSFVGIDVSKDRLARPPWRILKAQDRWRSGAVAKPARLLPQPGSPTWAADPTFRMQA